MARRELLHRNHVHRFALFMQSRGFQQVDCKGDYEAFRFQKASRKVILYKKLRAREYLTVRDVDLPFVYTFLQTLKQEGGKHQ